MLCATIAISPIRIDRDLFQQRMRHTLLTFFEPATIFYQGCTSAALGRERIRNTDATTTRTRHTQQLGYL